MYGSKPWCSTASAIRVFPLPTPKVLRNSVGGVILAVHLTTPIPLGACTNYLAIVWIKMAVLNGSCPSRRTLCLLRRSPGILWAGSSLACTLPRLPPPKFLHGGGSRVARTCADPAGTSASRSPPSVAPSSTALGDDGRRCAPPLRRLHDCPATAILPAACGTGPTRLC